jgi:hypothetical protein
MYSKGPIIWRVVKTRNHFTSLFDSKVVREFFLGADPLQLKTYHAILVEFYQNQTNNQKLACQRLCYHLPFVEDKKMFLDFLKSKKCVSNMSNIERSRHLNVI